MASSAKYSPVSPVGEDAPQAGGSGAAPQQPQQDASHQSPELDGDARAEVQWAAGGQKMAAVTMQEKVLEEKERRLLESIHKNYGRIREVERELAALQLQLRMNVGPKKQALEMLRRKIEAQNERVQAATARRDAAKKVYEEAAEVLASEERAKEQLCQELNLLVQQSATAQLDKLDQLTRRLELLNSGIAIAEEAEVASRLADRAGEPGSATHLAAAVQQGADVLRSQILAAAGANGTTAAQQHQQQFDPTNPFAGPAQQQGGGGGGGAQPGAQPASPGPAAAAAAQRAEAEAAERQRAEAERRKREAQAQAEAARARHVSIGRGGGRAGRGAGGRGQQGRMAPAAPAQQPQEPRASTDERGVFRGFE